MNGKPQKYLVSDDTYKYVNIASTIMGFIGHFGQCLSDEPNTNPNEASNINTASTVNDRESIE